MEELTSEQAEKAVQLYLGGHEPSKVAKRIGVAREQVCKALMNSGCKIRRPGSMVSPKPGSFGNILRARRRLKGLTLKELANRMAITWDVIWRWEHGKKEPTFPQLRQLSEALEVEPMVLAGWILRPAVQD